MKDLQNITDEDAIACANIAKIQSDYEFNRSGGRDNGCIDVIGKSKRGKLRSLRIYFNGSNTKVIHEGYEVVEYCFEIYDYLRSIGYDVQPNKLCKSDEGYIKPNHKAKTKSEIKPEIEPNTASKLIIKSKKKEIR